MTGKLIITGGGTGGHIFPAMAIAQEWERRWPDSDILFVGSKGGMEEEVIPKKGYNYQSIWISGIHRKKTLRNLLRNSSFPLKLIYSLGQARGILSRFNPQLVIGVGGFASGPIGKAAAWKGIPLFICEQNAYPGLVNKWLAPQAKLIILGNGAAKKYFSDYPTVETGNPIRKLPVLDKEQAAQIMGLAPQVPTLLNIGGSLGAASLNAALLRDIDKIIAADVQLIWQCGKHYYEKLKAQVPTHPSIKLIPFIEHMGAAYSLADLVISRAGGSTISELIDLSKPAILVPSPNVAEDHQTKNALSLRDKQAAIVLSDKEASEQLVDRALSTLQDPDRLSILTDNIQRMEKYDSAKKIVDEITKMLR